MEKWKNDYDFQQRVDQSIIRKEELHNYITNILNVESLECGNTYLKIKSGDFEMSFRLNEYTTVNSLKDEIRNSIKSKIKFFQDMLDKI